MGHTPNPTVDTSPYTSLTARMALNLAAPHTWPAAVLPCLVAMAAGSIVGPVHLSTALVLLAICVLMQASVNTFNDYYDYVKGADSVDDNLEADDNVLAYNAVNPAHVKLLAAGFLAAAFVLGAYIILAERLGAPCHRHRGCLLRCGLLRRKDTAFPTFPSASS